MSFFKALSNKKNNTVHIKFLVVATIFLASLSFGIYSLYSEKHKATLINAQEEKEQLVADELTELISLGGSGEKKNIFNESIEKIINDNGVRQFFITDSKDSVLMEFNSRIENEPMRNPKDIFQFKKTIRINSQDLNLFYEFSRGELNFKIEKYKTEIGLVSLFIFIISFLVLFVASLIIMLPLQKISNSVVEISTGNLTKRLDVKNKNEFSKIVTAVNAMAENLQKANTQVDKLNKELKFQFRDKIGELNYEINQRRQAEHSLKQSEEQFKLLFELAPIGMVISSIYGKILKVNAAFHTALGYTEHEILEKKTKDLTFLEDQPADILIHENLVGGTEQSAYYEKRMVRKDGEVIYVIVEAAIVKDKEGKPSHIIEQVIDITERKRVEKELIFSKEKAEESDRLKSAFLAQMSHEIRTPLNVILTAMSLIQDDFKDTDEETKVILDSVSSAGKRLQRTIDLILNISAVQSGSYSPERKKFDLDKELMILVEEFKTFENEKDIRISYINKSRQSSIVADHYSVTQIFQNLIGNAIKYTPKGNIDVIMDDWSDDKLRVIVKDTGIGISKDYIANLFSPFSQEDVGHKREFEGNGLGLALVKKYVEMNNADIVVESEKDRGSTFTVIFNKKLSKTNSINDQTAIKSRNVTELV
jgi:PAS domain S-box-containing protein